MDGLEGKSEVAGNYKRKLNYSDLSLRVLALALTLVAAIVLGVGKQNKVVPLKIIPTLPPVNVAVTAKWQYSSAFVFNVVSNAIACSYAAISLLLVLADKNGNKGLAMLILLLDLAMVALLFSANGAAGAVGLVGYQGNSHVQWKKVCNVFGKFCSHVAVAVLLSLLGSLAFFLLVAFAAMRILKKTN